MRIKVPEPVAVSPQDGTALTFESETQLFRDRHDNAWTLDQLSGSRTAQRIRKWVRENLPQKDGA